MVYGKLVLFSILYLQMQSQLFACRGHSLETIRVSASAPSQSPAGIPWCLQVWSGFFLRHPSCWVAFLPAADPVCGPHLVTGSRLLWHGAACSRELFRKSPTCRVVLEEAAQRWSEPCTTHWGVPRRTRQPLVLLGFNRNPERTDPLRGRTSRLLLFLLCVPVMDQNPGPVGDRHKPHMDGTGGQWRMSVFKN